MNTHQHSTAATRPLIFLSMAVIFAYCSTSAQEYDILELRSPDGQFAHEGAAINHKGQAAVIWNGTTPPFHQSFLFTHGRLVDLGSFGSSTDAYGINDNGDVVGQGYFSDNKTGRAFLKKNDPNSPILDLGTLGGTDSYASAINNLGQIVGWSSMPPPNDQAHAFRADGANGRVCRTGSVKLDG